MTLPRRTPDAGLALLGPVAALATPRRPGAAAITVATGIELLRGALPLGRVVSPVDALLNATGAVVTGLVVVRMRGLRPGWSRPHR
jgi:hypothetical protein